MTSTYTAVGFGSIVVFGGKRGSCENRGFIGRRQARVSFPAGDTTPQVSMAMMRRFTPTARQLNFLIPIGLLALGYALYLRYLAVEQAWVGLSCQAGLATWLCFARQIVITLFKHWVFGSIAVAVAVVNLVRPSLTLFSIGMVAAAFGIVLYNIGGSGIAIGLLILSFARPVRETV